MNEEPTPTMTVSQTPPAIPVPGTGNQTVTSHGQLGGITAHTVNINPARVIRKLNAALGDSLVSALRPLGKHVQVMGLNGNTESMTFAAEIHAYLKAAGLNVSPKVGWHMFFDPPVFNVTISRLDDDLVVVVGPAE